MNPRPLEPQSSALPLSYSHHKSGREKSGKSNPFKPKAIVSPKTVFGKTRCAPAGIRFPSGLIGWHDFLFEDLLIYRFRLGGHPG